MSTKRDAYRVQGYRSGDDTVLALFRGAEVVRTWDSWVPYTNIVNEVNLDIKRTRQDE